MAELEEDKKRHPDIRVVKSHEFDPHVYETEDRFIPGNGANPHTTPELVSLLESDSSVEIDARVLSQKGNELRYRKFDRGGFLEAWKKQDARFKEGSFDAFSMDTNNLNSNYGIVGEQDFIPYLGGPFYKQLYYYDYIKMHGQAFYAWHHDPMANNIVNIMVNFTLGREWRVDSDDTRALALWEAFAEVNNLQDMMMNLATEFSVYGEDMIWWLPDNQTKIGYQLKPGQTVPRGTIPRVRLIDPSAIWEIVTYPEDITRILYYQWVAPTQYQTYTAPQVPSTKFIFQQIPADQIMHYKTNCASNEKRGRSDLYPVMGYLKRLRDTINYSILSMQKNSAWSIDTTVDGSQADIDAYVADQKALGTIPTAASEFVHSKKIERKYNAASTGGDGSRGSSGGAFDWCLNAIASGTGIPVGYLGTHLSGGGTRASAMVATEPVVKKFEMRQAIYKRIITDMWRRLMDKYGIDADCEVTFPEIVTQDRSAKLKDLALAEQSLWISSKRASTIAAKELGITDYEYDLEQQDIKAEGPLPAPLSKPADAGPGGMGAGGGSSALTPTSDEEAGSRDPINSDERRRLSMTRGL